MRFNDGLVLWRKANFADRTAKEVEVVSEAPEKSRSELGKGIAERQAAGYVERFLTLLGSAAIF